MSANASRHLSSRAYREVIAPPLVLLEQAEIVARIEAIRVTEAPMICANCGSTTPNVKTQKWCPCCQQMLPVVCFSRGGANGGGFDWKCKPCAAKRAKLYRSKVARMRRAG